MGTVDACFPDASEKEIGKTGNLVNDYVEKVVVYWSFCAYQICSYQYSVVFKGSTLGAIVVIN